MDNVTDQIDDTPKLFKRLMNMNKPKPKKPQQPLEKKIERPKTDHEARDNIHQEIKRTKKVSEKRKAKLKDREQKKRSKKQNSDDEKERIEIIPFGEIVQAPLKSLPKPRGKLQPKPQGKGLIAAELLDQERQRAIEAYRAQRKRQVFTMPPKE